ncbi:hypothetical protein VP01_2132g1 [Puccinia sorghi]|uniref:Uncharacterized protein n=1 Tax=Puccinia sorghi TaxID=27349 RepID=A0A0L6V9Z5_9BASI|nr:hypothetical protein VP01_2132g1 [Puccinia sorghi]
MKDCAPDQCVVIHIQDAPELGDNARELDKNGMIPWEVSVPHGGLFAAKNKVTKDNNWVFANFIEVISTPGEDGQKVIIRLIEKDPNVVAQKNKALKILKKKREPEADDDQPPIPSVGGAHSAKIVAKIRKICAQNPPCKHLTGNHKIPVFINPKNKNEFFRITLWAMAMPMQSPGVPTTPKAPPTSGPTPSPLGQTPVAVGHSPHVMPYPSAGNIMYIPYQPLAPAPIQYLTGYGHPAAHQTPLMYQGGMMIPPYGHPMHPMALSQTSSVAAPPPGSTQPGVPSSPAASEGVDLEEYMLFSHFDPTNLVIQCALEEIGITHYSRNFKASELEEAGIKKGHSHLLIGNLTCFEQHLKSCEPHPH